MPTEYLQASDYAAYGLPASTTSAQVAQASALIDAYLYRPEGLMWKPDASGRPCYMDGLSPVLSLAASSVVNPGLNVAVPVTGPASVLQPGEVLIFDRADTAKTEACVVTAAVAGSVTLQSVQFAHVGGAKLESGLVIEELKMMPKSRPITNVSRTPFMRLLSGVGRYGYGRRGDVAGNLDDFNLLAAVTQFGGPPVWEMFSAANAGVDVTTGQVWVPAGVMLAYYSEVKLRYIAGYAYESLPPVVKFACVALIQAIANQPAMGAVKSFKAGDTAVAKFTESVFDDDIKRHLNPFRTHLWT
jgi:hypothetical protein